MVFGILTGLSVTEGDAALSQVVGRQFQGDPVAGQDANSIPPQAAGQVGQNNAVMFQLHAEQPAGEFFQNRTGYFNAVFLAHRPLKVGLGAASPRRPGAPKFEQTGAPASDMWFNQRSH